MRNRSPVVEYLNCRRVKCSKFQYSSGINKYLLTNWKNFIPGVFSEFAEDSPFSLWGGAICDDRSYIVFVDSLSDAILSNCFLSVLVFLKQIHKFIRPDNFSIFYKYGRNTFKDIVSSSSYVRPSACLFVCLVCTKPS